MLTHLWNQKELLLAKEGRLPQKHTSIRKEVNECLPSAISVRRQSGQYIFIWFAPGHFHSLPERWTGSLLKSFAVSFHQWSQSVTANVSMITVQRTITAKFPPLKPNPGISNNRESVLFAFNLYLHTIIANVLVSGNVVSGYYNHISCCCCTVIWSLWLKMTYWKNKASSPDFTF